MSIKLTLNDYYNALSLVEYRTISQITKNIFEAKGLQDPETIQDIHYADNRIPGFTYKRYQALNRLVSDRLATRDFIPLNPQQQERNATLHPESFDRTIPRSIWKKLPTGVRDRNPNGLFSIDDLVPA